MMIGWFSELMLLRISLFVLGYVKMFFVIIVKVMVELSFRLSIVISGISVLCSMCVSIMCSGDRFLVCVNFMKFCGSILCMLVEVSCSISESLNSDRLIVGSIRCCRLFIVSYDYLMLKRCVVLLCLLVGS